MDKMKLAQAIIDSLDMSEHLDACDIASLDGVPQVDAQGNITIELTRHDGGGFRQLGPLVNEVCKLTLTFERTIVNYDEDTERTEAF